MSGNPGNNSGSQTSPSTPAPPAGVDASGGSPALTRRNVTVSLRVNVDLSSNVDLFAYPADAAVNPVYVAATVSAADISGLFEYLENGVNGEDISGSLTASPSTKATALGSDIQTAACSGSNGSNLDASAAAVFSGYAGTNSSYATLGDLALSWAAYEMFGHPAATAVIDNDADVISDINSQPAAKITAGILALAQADLDAIAKSVIGQDASRGSQDGENRDGPKPIEFFAGDVIIVRVNLRDFTTSNANSNQKNVSTDFGLEGAAQQYDLVLTLA